MTLHPAMFNAKARKQKEKCPEAARLKGPDTAEVLFKMQEDSPYPLLNIPHRIKAQSVVRLH